MADTVIDAPAKPVKAGLPSWVTETPNVGSGGITTNKPDPEPPPNVPPPEPDPVKPKLETPKKADAPAADDDEAWPRSAEQWKAKKAKEKERRTAIEKERDEIKADREKLAAEIAELRKAGPSDELDKLRAERDDLDRRLKESALEHHPKFVEYFDGNIKNATESIKRLVGADKAGSIESLVNLPPGEYRDARLQELADELPVLKQGQLAGLLNKIEELQNERSSELKRQRENWDRITKEQTAAQMARQKSIETEREKVVTGTIAAIASEELKGHLDEQGADLAKRVSLGGTKDPADTVKLIARGVAYPKVLSALAEAQKEVESLKAQVAKMEAATPGAPGGGGKSADTGTSKPKYNANSPMGTAAAWVADWTTKSRQS